MSDIADGASTSQMPAGENASSREHTPVAAAVSARTSGERTCWVCFMADSDRTSADGTKELQWRHPCKCSGSVKWVHDACLQRWIDEKQKGSVHVPVCARSAHAL